MTDEGLAHSERLDELAKRVVECRRCPRLVGYRESVAPRRSFSSETYWRRPVPGFGDPDASLVVIGLAPAAHGGNRTGRVFTGDASGRFLVRALHDAGYANQAASESKEDGLVYAGCYLTAAVKCVPPDDKPAAEEFENCSKWLDSELRLLTNVKVVLALGRGAFAAYLRYARGRGVTTRGKVFEHGRRYAMRGLPILYASYHPSPRNTYTGKLTMRMMTSLLDKVRREVMRDDKD